MSVRPVDVGRLAVGLLALSAPGLCLRVFGSRDGVWPRRVTRVLGLRYVIQSGGGVLLGRPWIPEVDVGVDVAHAVSMLLAARVFPDHRRLALTSAVLAAGFASADAAERR